MYPFEVYYPDDPTRLCRPKAGQSLVQQMKIPHSILSKKTVCHKIVSEKGSQKLTITDEERRGVERMMTIADEGEGGSRNPQI